MPAPSVEEVNNAVKKLQDFLDRPEVKGGDIVHLEIVFTSNKYAKQWQYEINMIAEKGKYNFEFSVMFINGKWLGLLNYWYDGKRHEMEHEEFTSESYYAVVKQAYDFYLTVKDEK
jgi:hypothetical protein